MNSAVNSAAARLFLKCRDPWLAVNHPVTMRRSLPRSLRLPASIRRQITICGLHGSFPCCRSKISLRDPRRYYWRRGRPLSSQRRRRVLDKWQHWRARGRSQTETFILVTNDQRLTSRKRKTLLVLSAWFKLFKSKMDIYTQTYRKVVVVLVVVVVVSSSV